MSSTRLEIGYSPTAVRSEFTASSLVEGVSIVLPLGYVKREAPYWDPPEKLVMLMQRQQPYELRKVRMDAERQNRTASWKRAEYPA